MPSEQSIYNLSDHPRFRPARQLITRKALMGMWSVKSVNTIKTYVAKGMPEERMPGGHPRYDVAACEIWRQNFNGRIKAKA